MPYDIFLHKHKFSVWAAARAAQRGLQNANVEKLRSALEQSGVVEFLQTSGALDTEEEEYKTLHRAWCNSILHFMHGNGIQRATFGRAAKLLAIYLKSMVVVGSDPNCRLALVLHPPVDSILLRNLSNSPEIQSPHKQSWGQIRWTQLNENQYYNLMLQLSSVLNNGEPLWYLEKYWTVT